ncbi:hypothetical protein [Rhizobium sp. R339]|uniref:hypothetical protein n=1 Tax=Rhizobium sp. R339 TaxID=1764273 RepID=UPI0032AEC2D5
MLAPRAADIDLPLSQRNKPAQPVDLLLLLDTNVVSLRKVAGGKVDPIVVVRNETVDPGKPSLDLPHRRLSGRREKSEPRKGSPS